MQLRGNILCIAVLKKEKNIYYYIILYVVNRVMELQR